MTVRVTVKKLKSSSVDELIVLSDERIEWDTSGPPDMSTGEGVSATAVIYNEVAVLRRDL